MPRTAEPEPGPAGRGDGLLTWAAGWLLWGLSLSWRVRLDHREHVESVRAAGRPAILALYHGRMLMGARLLRPFASLVMVSHSRDGERIARTIERIDWKSIRGSSSRGGARALLELARRLSPEVSCCHLVDGPLGPAGEVKPGLLALAKHSGALIVPVYLAGKPCWEASSWDRFQVPLPFARIHARFGKPFEVPATADPAELETLRVELEALMAEGYARLDDEAFA